MSYGAVIEKLLDENRGLKSQAEALLARSRLSDAEVDELVRAIHAYEGNLRYIEYERAAGAKDVQLQALKTEIEALKARAKSLMPELSFTESSLLARGEAAAEAHSKLRQLGGLTRVNRNVNDANMMLDEICLQLDRDMQRFMEGRVTLKLLDTEVTLSSELIGKINAMRRRTDRLFKASMAAPIICFLIYLLLKLLRLFRS